MCCTTFSEDPDVSDVIYFKTSKEDKTNLVEGKKGKMEVHEGQFWVCGAIFFGFSLPFGFTSVRLFIEVDS